MPGACLHIHRLHAKSGCMRYSSLSRPAALLPSAAPFSLIVAISLLPSSLARRGLTVSESSIFAFRCRRLLAALVACYCSACCIARRGRCYCRFLPLTTVASCCPPFARRLDIFVSRCHLLAAALSARSLCPSLQPPLARSLRPFLVPLPGPASCLLVAGLSC